MPSRRAFLFPGLGGYLPGALAKLAPDRPSVRRTLQPIDQAAQEYGFQPPSTLLLDPDGPQIEDLAATPTLLHLAAIGTSLSVHTVLGEAGIDADVVLGHSTGELTALAAAGCLSSYDAARVLCEREQAMSELDSGGGLVALQVGAVRAGHLCGATGDRALALSLFNSPRQTIVSGRDDGLAVLEKVARAAGVQATRLLVRHPHHSHLLAPAAARVAEATSGYRVHAPHRSIYSPMLGRPLVTAADARELIARDLTAAVDYLGALRELYGNVEVDQFVEVGARSILTDLVTQCLPATVRVAAPLRFPVGSDELLAGAVPQAATRSPMARSAAADPRSPEQSAQPYSPQPSTARSANGAVPNGSATSDSPTGSPATNGSPTGGAAAHGSAAGDSPTNRPSSSGAAPVTDGGDRLPAESDLVAELRQVFADALGYPVDVFTEDAHLEADLGIASVKKTELLVKMLDQYHLPTPTSEIRMRDYNTVPKLAELMHRLAAQDNSAAV